MIKTSAKINTESITRGWNIILLIFLMELDSSLGISVTLSGSSTVAEYNKPFTLTCRVTEASELKDEIRFYKKTDEAMSTFSSKDQHMDFCEVFISPPPGYTLTCGQGTDRAESEVKLYSLQIEKVADHDVTEWSCRLVASDVISKYTLQIKKDGGWGPFSEDKPGTCSTKCGTGTRKVTRTRKCNNPAPTNGGEMCQGKDKVVRTEVCEISRCNFAISAANRKSVFILKLWDTTKSTSCIFFLLCFLVAALMM